MEILSALFVDNVDLRPAEGGASRIDLIGVQFSAVAPTPLPLTWAPHLAVIITALAFLLILFFDVAPACRVKIDRLPAGRLHESADAYRAVLTDHRCKLISEHKSTSKDRVEFVFRLHRSTTRDRLHLALCGLPPELRGDIDWEIE